MIKLPTVKLNGKTAFVINRHQVEDDVAVAEAICRDAERYRKIRNKEWLRDAAMLSHGMSPEDFDAYVDNDFEHK